MTEKFMIRLVDLIQEDPELKQALLEAINAKAAADRALAAWRDRRK